MFRIVAWSSVGLAIAVLIAGCSRRPTDTVEESPPFQKPVNAEQASDEDRAALVRDSTHFALDLHRQLPGEGNLVTSPFAVSTVLSMSLAGARGQTASEMKRALRFSLDQDRLHQTFASLLWELHGQGQPPGYHLSLASALWTDRQVQLRKPFLQTLESNYSIGGRFVDFDQPEEACRAINDWARTQTGGRIKEVMAPDEVTTRDLFLLTSAVSFQGQWKNPFPAGLTQNGPFHVAADRTVNVPLMHQEGEFTYRSLPAGEKKDAFGLLSLPFRGRKMQFVILLPDKVDGLPALEKQLSPKKLSEWLYAAYPHNVRLTLPRLQMRSRLSLIAALKALGMSRAFQSEKADFTGMVVNENLPVYLARVMQQATVVVNEEGAEATAVADAKGRDKDSGPPPGWVTFRVDRPFLFLIRHRDTGTILFLGRVTDPAA